MRTVADDVGTERRELLELRTRLYGHLQQGMMHPDVDAAYWTVDRALAGKVSVDLACRYAREALSAVEPPVRVEVQARVISKEEHDAMLEGSAQRSVSKEDYERMMREAQE